MLHPAPDKNNRVGPLPESYLTPEQAEAARLTLVTYFGDHPNEFHGMINSQFDAELRKREDAAIESARLQKGLTGKDAQRAARRAQASILRRIVLLPRQHSRSA